MTSTAAFPTFTLSSVGVSATAQERDGLDGVFKSSDADALLTLVRTIGRATTHLQA